MMSFPVPVRATMLSTAHSGSLGLVPTEKYPSVHTFSACAHRKVQPRSYFGATPVLRFKTSPDTPEITVSTAHQRRRDALVVGVC